MRYGNGGNGCDRFLNLLPVLSIVAVLLVGKAQAVGTDVNQPGDANAAKVASYHPYCGLYDIYAVMKLAGKEIDFRDLVKPEYISSQEGSTMKELKQAAEDHGLYVKPVGNLTSRDLRQSPYPIILYVKSSMDEKEYDHYELFLDTRNGKARLFNPPEPIKLVPFEELAPRWSGVGLIVSATPISSMRIFSASYTRLACYGAAGVLVILAIRRLRRRWSGSGAGDSVGRRILVCMVQCGCLCGIAYFGGLTYHFAHSHGLLARAEATGAVVKRYEGSFIPKVSKREVKRLLGTDAVFVDARLAEDFKMEHLEGAISVPVNSSDEELEKTMGNITKDARIVVYCQSAACKYAEGVAIRLMDDGFANVSLFKGGWREWVQDRAEESEE